MGLLETIINFILHVDQYLDFLIRTFGVWTYFILFAVIFIETGLVVTPFLPGDSLIFIAGVFASVGSLNIFLLFIVFALGAILGDTVNYWVGKNLGRRIFHEKSRFLKKEYLDEAEKFYDKYGVETIIIARFVPIVRTIAPFVAGMGKMSYRRFITYNIVGGIAWVTTFLLAGYFFGVIPFVKNNLSIIIIGIIFVSLIPPFWRYASHFMKQRKVKQK
jgi:membrane-associated protein